MRGMEIDGVLPPIFRRSRDLPPLQAADLIAWEYRRFLDTSESGTFSGYRKPFKRFLSEFHQDWTLYYDNIEENCILNQVPERIEGVTFQFRGIKFRAEINPDKIKE